MNMPEALSISYQPEQSYQCGELRITSDSFGNPGDPPILLIMGLSTQLIHWPEPFCRALAKQGFWVIRMDNRDMGKSTLLRQHKPPSFAKLLAHKWFNKRIHVPYQLQHMAQDCIALLDQLDIDKAHVIGASMGGMIAQLMAIEHPKRVASLTSIMSTTGEKRLMRPSHRVLWCMAQKPGKGKAEHIQQGLKLWRVLHQKALPFPHARFVDTMSQAYERGFHGSGVLRQLAAIVTAPDRTAKLRALQVPSLIIHGALDPMLKVDNAYALQRAIPHAKTLILEKMGHTLPEEYWPEMIESITDLVHGN